MKTPEQRKKEMLEQICSFLREERFDHWKFKDIELIEAAIEAAYEAGKNSCYEPIEETLAKINYCVNRGYFNGKR